MSLGAVRPCAVQRKSNFALVAKLAREHLAGRPQLFERILRVLIHNGQLDIIDVPTDHPRLSPRMYEFVLHNCIICAPARFGECIKKWDPSLYDVSVRTCHASEAGPITE